MHKVQQRITEKLILDGHVIESCENSEIHVYLHEHGPSLLPIKIQPYEIKEAHPMSEDSKFQSKLILRVDWEEVEENER